MPESIEDREEEVRSPRGSAARATTRGSTKGSSNQRKGAMRPGTLDDVSEGQEGTSTQGAALHNEDTE